MYELWVDVKSPKHLHFAIGQSRRLSLPSFSKGRWKCGMKVIPKKWRSVVRTGYRDWVANLLSLPVCHAQGERFLQIFNQAWSLGWRQCWQWNIGTANGESRVQSCLDVIKLIFFWGVWRTWEGDAIAAAQTWGFIAGYLKNKRRSRHFVGLSSHDVT